MSDEQPKKKVRIKVWVLGALAVTAFVILFWQGPWWFDSAHIRDTNLEPADGVVITGFRTGLVAFAAGIIAGLGLYYTHKKHDLEQRQFEHARQQFEESQKQFETTLRETQKRDERQAELTREGQVTDRYVEAVKLLASEKLHERLGGIYALDRIMIDSPRDQDTILRVLAAFLRTQPKRDQAQKPSGTRLAVDVQAALDVMALLRNNEARPVRPNLRGAPLAGADLVGANLDGADLQGADLRGADLSHAQLRSAVLTDTDLSGATLFAAIAPHAKFIEANLYEADLDRADLSHASVEGANLELTRLNETNLDRAYLGSVSLIATQCLRGEQLATAHISDRTQLPADISQHPAVQARLAEVRAEEEDLSAAFDDLSEEH